MLRKTVIIVLLITLHTFGASAVAAACSIVTVSDNTTVFFGNNEDYSNPNTCYWVDIPESGQYAGVYFGFDNFWPQGGINEKGLAFDINSLPKTPMNPHPELLSFSTYEGYSILRNCATVEEAIDHLRRFNWGSEMGGQIHIADASGAAVVAGPGVDGELAFTRKTSEDRFLVSTNFNVAEGYDGDGECERYETAAEMLGAIGADETLDLAYITALLDAVHVQGMGTNTLYSTVYDLKNGTIVIYYYHNFDEYVELDVAETISTARKPTRLSELFPPAIVASAESEHAGYVFLEIFLKVSIIVVPLGLIVLAFIVLRRRRRRGKNVSA